MSSKRCANFSNEESRMLLSLVRKYADVIENKKTDAVTWQNKKNAWEKLANSFNARSSSLVPRTADQLRTRYEKLKKQAKAMKAGDKNAMYKTGGGRFEPPHCPERDLLEAVLELIPLAGGLEPEFDSDAQFSVPEVPVPTAAASPILEPPKKGLQSWEDEDDAVEIEIIMEEDLPLLSELASTSEPGDWSKYTPKHLKRTKHPALCKTPTKGKETWATRRRPQLSEKQQMAASVNTGKFANMAETKTELAQLQIQVCRATEADRQRSEAVQQKHQELLNSLEIKIKEAELELLLSKLEMQRAQLSTFLKNPLITVNHLA